ncbi:MAG: cation transporter [Solirubrobacterales bacterium]|nr:cation transporter [Solirubrobacterales bacterium]
MSEGHSHATAASAGSRHLRPLAIALALTATYMVVEVVAGILTNSLALISDAGHMLTDVVGLSMALAAIRFSQSRRDTSHTYGLYRLEILASLVNALLLFAVSGYVIYEAVQRFSEPPEVRGVPLMVVAAVGLIVNLISFRLLAAGSKESINVRGAFLEVMADALGSAGVLLAGLILITTGWQYADPLIGAGIGLFILPRTWRLAKASLRILLEIAPANIDVGEIQSRLASIPGVEEVHDLHVWTLTSGIDSASGHLALTEGADVRAVLSSATTLFQNEFGVSHVTLQCEPQGFREKPITV